MKKLFGISILAIIALAAASCAREETTNREQAQEEYLAKWVETNYPEAQKHPDGFYYISYPGTKAGAKTPAQDNWVKIQAVGRTLDGHVFYNTDPELSKVLGTYSHLIHYVPEYLAYYEKSSKLTPAQYTALGMMAEGDSVKIIMPSRLGYKNKGYSNSYGFGGNVTLAAVKPAILDMKLVEVVEDPLATERNQALRYAIDSLGLTANDTIGSGVYFKKLTSKPGNELLHKDSLAFINYAGYFLDGFLIDTNIDTIAVRHNRYNPTSSSTYMPINLQYALIPALKQIYGVLRYEEEAVLVFDSRYGFALAGNYASIPVIYGLTPLTCYIKVYKKTSE